jgi:hypothetical protein
VIVKVLLEQAARLPPIRPGWVLALLMLLPACAGEPGGPDRAACERLRDHVVELQLAPLRASRGGDPQVAAELDQHRSNLAASLSDDYLAQCQAGRSRQYLDCALAAASTEELSRCPNE